MKTLQNNFTTPEQSKRLLELGIPADSADCYYTEILWHRPRFITEDTIPNWNARLMDGTQKYLPCWSVGRLIEIAFICFVYKNRTIEFWRNDEPMIDILYEFENNKMDFSELED